MRIFIGMESSGVSRREFSRLGHDVISCDLLAQDDEPGIGRHIQGDVFETLNALKASGWWPDFALFHPTCTFLTFSAEWAYKDPDFTRYPGVGYHQRVKPGTLTGNWRRMARESALQDMRRIADLPIEGIVVENPKGAYDAHSPGFQIVQPYQFGDDASKETHLHLIGVEPLPIPDRSLWVPPRLVDGKPRWANQTDSGQNRLSPGADRWKERSATYPGLARAWAEHWGRPPKRLAA